MPTQTYFDRIARQVHELLGCRTAALVLDCPEPALRHPLLTLLPTDTHDSYRYYGSTSLRPLLGDERVRALCDMACQRGEMRYSNDQLLAEGSQVVQNVAIAPISSPAGVLGFFLLVDASGGGFSEGECNLWHDYLAGMVGEFEAAVCAHCRLVISRQMAGCSRAVLPGGERGKGEQQQGVDGGSSLLVSMVSHELRTPLAAILGYAGLLQAYSVVDRGHPGDDETAKVAMTPARQQQYLDRIVEEARQLEALVDDLLDVSRVRAGKLRLRCTQVDVGPLCQQVFHLAQQRIEQQGLREHEIRCLLAPELPLIWADANRLRQVLYNLLDNAIKYSPKGGLIELKAWFQPPVSAARKEVPMVQIAVRDQGVGIAEEERARLFLPFSRIEQPEVREAQGAGLGLGITRELVEAMGGTIELTSREGVGTEVVTCFPVHSPIH